MKEIVAGDIRFQMIGPDISQGPLPTIFYFAVTALETLTVEPFAQALLGLDLTRLRVMSVSTPGHHEPGAYHEAIGKWVSSYKEGNDQLGIFFERVAAGIEDLAKRGYLLSHQVALMGLSRGALVATHIALRLPFVAPVVGFAPMIALSQTQEGLKQNLKECSHDLIHHVDALVKLPITYYVGNRDMLINSQAVVNLILKVADRAHALGGRQLPYELHLFPSIGYKGHGTPLEVFRTGSERLGEMLHGK